MDLTFFERCGTTFADIEGVTWNTLSLVMEKGAETEKSYILKVIRRAVNALPKRQRQIIQDYYFSEDEPNQKDLAEKYGICPSSVARTFSRARKNIINSTIASLIVFDCFTKDGKFDYIRFTNNCSILTERQRETLFFLLTDRVTFKEIAEYQKLNPATVYRSFSCILNKFESVCAGVYEVKSVIPVSKEDWVDIPEKQIAEMLGIAPSVYYKNICRKERYKIYNWKERKEEEVNRLTIEILVKRDKGIDETEIAKALGIGKQCVHRYLKFYNDYTIEEKPELDTYNPVQIVKQNFNISQLLTKLRVLDGVDEVNAEAFTTRMQEC